MASEDIRLELDPRSYRDFQRALGKLAPEAQKELNKQFRRMLGPLVAGARARASWSSRIPDAIRPQVTPNRVGLRIDRKKAPHGRAYEALRKNAVNAQTFRHPVFAGPDRVDWRWVEQRSRPFVLPTIDEHRTQFYEQARRAMATAAEKAGFDGR
jgi:hypothetical protein